LFSLRVAAQPRDALQARTIKLTQNYGKSLKPHNFFSDYSLKCLFFRTFGADLSFLNVRDMRKYAFSLLFMVVALCCGCGGGEAADVADYQSIDTLPMLITQIQKCSRLYTTEYHIHKIVTHDDVLQLKGSVLKQDISIRMPMGERKIAIPMDATVKAYVDMADFSEKNVERHGNKITLLLPDPRIVLTSSKIDQKSIKQFVGLTRAHFSDEEMSHYEQQGREAIIKSAEKMGIVETARASAARTIIPLLEQLGYQEQDITISFRRDIGSNGIRSLFDFSTIEKK
jgi:hypothetical protein